MAVQVTVLSIDDEQLSAPKKSVFIKNDISIGRSRLNDLVLEHPGVSNTHARVRIEGVNGSTRFFVSDLDSTNGTMIGNKRLDPRSETQLNEKDRIMIAGYILKLDSVSDELAVPAPSKSIPLSAESTQMDGRTTQAMLRPEKPMAPENLQSQNLPRENMPSENMPSNGTIWNSSLLGAYREEKQPQQAIQQEMIDVTPQEATPVETPIAEAESLLVEPDIIEETEEAPGLPDFSAETKLVVSDNLTLDFVATRLLSILGKVERNGVPLEGVTVIDQTLGTTRTDDTGSFRFSDVIEGTAYSFKFEKEGYTFSPQESSGDLNDENLELLVSARKLFSITGAITHRGKGLEGVTVDGGELGITVTDDQGCYRFESVPEGGEFTLKATKEGYTFGTVQKST